MPTYSTEVEVDISYDEFWDDLRKSEKEDFLDFLHDKGVISLPTSQSIDSHQQNLLDLEWDEVCSGLSQIRLNITPEEQEIIEKIYRKYR